MELERGDWLRGLWETLKEILLQKLLTYHLRSSPLVLPSRLFGLNVIVTGATSGIGLHVARELAMAGAHVVMACRNVDAANETYGKWREELGDGRALNVKIMELDLLSLGSVRRFAADWDHCLMPLHILINNAGILRMGDKQQFSKDGIEQHLQVNHVATALLTLLLLPSMLRATTWRLVNVNSVTHHWGAVELKSWKSRIEDDKFSAMKAYGSSKLLHLMFMKALACNLLEQGFTSVQCVAVHPGIVTTNLVPGLKKVFWRLHPSEGARSVLHCATSEEVVERMVKGFAYYSSNCRPAELSPKALNVKACFNVFEATLTILDFDPSLLNYPISKTMNARASVHS